MQEVFLQRDRVSSADFQQETRNFAVDGRISVGASHTPKPNYSRSAQLFPFNTVNGARFSTFGKFF
jgi:hypothetical protein